MSKVVFLELRLFRNSMIETYQINQLREAGHQVEIWHLGSLFGVSNPANINAPAIMQYMVMINNFSILKEKIRKLEKNSVLFSTLGLLYYYPVLYKFIKARKDLVWIGRTTKTIPTSKKKHKSALRGIWGSIVYFNLYKPFSNVIYYLTQKVIRKYGHTAGLKSYQPDYLMVSNAKQVPRNFPAERTIVTHADDYNVHLLNKDATLGPSLHDAIVFLDQMIYFHPDFRSLGENPTDIEAYYQQLNKFLDDVSRKYGKPVVVAGHPEADKHPGYAERFGGKTLVIGKSATLVKYAALVVTHYSTAVNFAVIYNKPLLLLSTNKFESLEKIMIFMRALSRTLNTSIINIDSYNLQDIPALIEPDYKEYKDNYIKSDNTPDELSYPYAVNYVLERVENIPAKEPATNS